MFYDGTRKVKKEEEGISSSFGLDFKNSLIDWFSSIK